jgi:outer membrane protein TolC
MRKLLLLFLIPVRITFAQSGITLEECYKLARENYPNLKQSGLLAEISALKTENIRTNYLPKINLNGQATYQSDVTQIKIPIPNITIPTVAKDQYKIYLDFQENIWDGGISSAQKQLEVATLKTSLSQLENELYQIREKVNQAWFTAFLAKQSVEVIKTQIAVLDERIKTAQSGLKNGVAEKSNLDILMAEKISAEQQITEMESGYETTLKVLSILTGKEITTDTRLVQDEPKLQASEPVSRPELIFFDKQLEQLDASSGLLKRQRYPKVYGFGQAGYGRPGLNMLNDKFDTYYLVGVGLSWNVFDWWKTNRDRKVTELQKNMVRSQSETFGQNISILLEQQMSTISKLQKLIESDAEIITFREDVAKRSASKFDNDEINSSDYTTDLNAAIVARLKLETHKIQLREAIIKYNTIKGI